MLKLVLSLFIVLLNLSKAFSCVALYGQCAGLQYTGATDCCAPSKCQYSNPWYSQCLMPPTGSTDSTSVTSQAASSSSTTQSAGCNSLYSQCGGQNWSGATCCVNSVCTFVNSYYSQCLVPSQTSSATTVSTGSASTSTTGQTTTASTTRSTTVVTTSTVPSTTTTTTTKASTAQTSSTTPSAPAGCSAVYGQCGGQTWSGATCCVNSICVYVNPYYSQCLPTSTIASSTVSTATSTVDSTRQAGVTTRYWDCCKPSCGWPGKASVSKPVQTCAQNGVTAIDPNVQSVCAGGTAYMCNNQQPWNVSSTLSYGYAAAVISGLTEAGWCCACYSLLFTSGPVAGKEMIVQVTNTGGDLGKNHFDLQMPGGGVGLYNGCSSQFPGPYTWGNTYGGITQRSDCANLPSVIQPGCYWRFDWFMNADNPSVAFKQVACPPVLTVNTQCVRQ